MPNLTYPGPENIHRRVLDNGIVVLAYENFAVPSFVVEGRVTAGALAEPREKAGLANFTATMLMRGTAHNSFDEIYEKLESVNARLGFSSDIHDTSFGGGGLIEDLDLVLELLADSLRYPTFPADHVERVRGEALTSLQIRANDTGEMANLAFHKLLYGDHPYATSPDGYLETVAQISRDEQIAFHEQYYGPTGMIVTIVGAIKADDAINRVAAHLGDWQDAGQQPLPEVPPAARPLTTVRTHVSMPDKTQSDIVLGLPSPPRAAPDYLDLSLANTVLGVFGMYGRLGDRVREQQGLCYYIHSHLEGGFGPSPWYVSTGVAPDKVEEAIGSVLEEIGRMQDEPVPAEELADSQAYRTGSLPVKLETNRALAGNITSMELYDLGLDYLQRFPDLIRSLTAEHIQAAAHKYWSTTQLAIAVAGPGEDRV